MPESKTTKPKHDWLRQSRALALMVTQNQASMKWRLHTLSCCEGAVEAAYKAGREDEANGRI